MSWLANNLKADKHFFFGRQDGWSEGIYSGLNVNTKSNDNPENINKNLAFIANKFNLKSKDMLLLNQGTSSDAVFVNKPSHDVIFADGAVTATSGIILCIRTADCAPVLFEDRTNGIIGAAHAGWRGAFKGIIENVIKLMLANGAEINNISAAVGPCIAQKSYEVDDNFYNQFLATSPDNEKYFIQGVDARHHQFNLPLFCYDKIKNTGITNIDICNHDTYSMSEEYFSYRKLSHLGLLDGPKNFGTEMSAITI